MQHSETQACKTNQSASANPIIMCSLKGNKKKDNSNGNTATKERKNPLVPLTKHKRGASFAFVEGRGRTTNDHRGSGISTQTFLEYAGQFAVSIRNITLK